MGSPDYALAVSLIFTKATHQAIMLNEPPRHVCSTSILWNSLLHDKRFTKVPMSEAAPGDIIVESGWRDAHGYAGIIVDHGRIVSNSSRGVQNNSNLLEVQRHHPEMAIFRYIGFRNYYRKEPLANAGFNPDESRIPAGQPAGGQWTTGGAQMAPSTIALSGRNNWIDSEAARKVGEPDRSHDNSGGNPGVLIYTNNKDTYNRYTTMQSKYGQLAGAQVIYVGSPDSPNNAFLATDNPVNVSPSVKNVTYGNRVVINSGESWYYYSPQDARTKAEERAFIAISSHTPSMVGFSTAAGAGGDAVGAASVATDAATPPVDAGIQWGAGIKAQGDPWEKYLAARMPPRSETPPNFRTFDFYDPATGTATSAKTLETFTLSRMESPVTLYKSLVKSIDAAADFPGASKGTFKLTPSQIKSRVVEVAIPSTTTPDQMEEINAAVRYGRQRGVTVNITRTK
jgi:hypothetical protein